MIVGRMLGERACASALLVEVGIRGQVSSLVTGGRRRLGRSLRAVSALRELDDSRLERLHARAAGEMAVQGPRPERLAVVVHAFYPELLEQLQRALQPLADVGYDLYLTVPRSVERSTDVLLEDRSVQVLVYPNRGRDVLPFVTTARRLYQYGYTNVLKLHTKRSPHRVDGADWLDSLISNLIPREPEVLGRLLQLLAEAETGIVGPRGDYVSLSVNFAANEAHLRAALVRLRGSVEGEHRFLQPPLSRHRFFAGSMFWARLDALAPILSSARPRDFEPEDGRADGTYAHTVERMFSLVCEVNERRIYAVGEGAVEPIAYDSGIVPDWSKTLVHTPKRSLRRRGRLA